MCACVRDWASICDLKRKIVEMSEEYSSGNSVL